MAVVSHPDLAVADGFRVLSPDGTLGHVEEVWFGTREEPLAAVVRLRDGRRGLLLGDAIAAVSPPDESLTVAEGASLLRLEPPHLEERDGLAASWRATTDELELPAARHVTPAQRARPRVERPLWLTLALTLSGISVISCTVIGLDFLFAYLVGGGPPF